MRLKELRLERNLTQMDVADGIHTGQSNIGRWEREEVLPTADFIVKLANFFAVSTDYLLGRTDDLGVVVSADHEPQFSEEELALLRLYRRMSELERARFVAYGEGILGISFVKKKA